VKTNLKESIQHHKSPVLDIEKFRHDFPILSTHVHGKPLIYLDNAATSQKPQRVIDATSKYYCEQNANIHRGVHHLSQLATDLYERSRLRIGAFFGASCGKDLIFTRGATEAINLVTHSWGRTNLKTGDVVIISHMEHHSNIVPWQMACAATGAELKVIPITDTGELDMDAFANMLDERVKMVAVVHVSNALGTVNPIAQIIKMAHAVGAKVLIDGAQSVPHMRVNVRELDCDFFVCSSHKIYGPTGVGFLYGKEELLEEMPPYQGGGDMILSVSFEKTTYNHLPHKFEAGTPHIAGGIAFGAAIDYLEGVGIDAVLAHEDALLTYAHERVLEVKGLTVIGTAKQKAGVLSFVMDAAHPHDIGQILDGEGVAIRAGHHCAQPVMKRFGIPATARISLALYNTREDIDTAVAALHRVNKVFG